MKIEAKTLDEALIKASEELGISVAKLKYELIQRPKKGFFGFFAKNAIIKVNSKSKPNQQNNKTITITDEVMQNIKTDINSLLEIGLYDISLVEIKSCGDYVYVKLDGKDTNLIVGKDGKRYKALSYMLHNLVLSKYEIFIRLEVGSFLQEQIEQIENYILNIIEKTKQFGKYTTKPLDGAILKVVLDRLRDELKDKYVGIKNHPNGSKSIIIGDFIDKNTSKE